MRPVKGSLARPVGPRAITARRGGGRSRPHGARGVCGSSSSRAPRRRHAGTLGDRWRQTSFRGFSCTTRATSGTGRPVRWRRRSASRRCTAPRCALIDAASAAI